MTVKEVGRTGSVSCRVRPSPGSLRYRFLLCDHLLLVLVIAAGLGLRTFHFVRDPSMWHDEAALVLNVLQSGFGELLGPLRFAEAAPPLFLWAERAVNLTLGDSTFALRAVPFLAACLCVTLVAVVGRAAGCGGVAVWATIL